MRARWTAAFQSNANTLFGSSQQKLDWKTRRKISLDIARGLAYLHEESGRKIVHRDIQAATILLDKHLHAKISDFVVAILDEDIDEDMILQVRTCGYIAPEYSKYCHLTEKADVYSYGIVLLEIVSGTSQDDFTRLPDLARSLKDQGKLPELVDPIMGSNFSVTEAEQMLNVALLCINPSPTLRPTMTQLLGWLDHDWNPLWP